MICPSCRRKSGTVADYCPFCATALRPDLAPLTPVVPQETSAVVGGVLLTIIVFALFSPLLLIFLYGAFLILPFYFVAMVWMAIRNARICQSLCRVRRGIIPLQSWLGYVALVLCLIGSAMFSIITDQEREAARRAIQAQYGPLYYPGAVPDRDYPNSLRTSDSFGDVVRFYKGVSICNDQKGWYGGGEYNTFCKRSEDGTPARIQICSRVDNNEPYVLIGFESY